MTPTQFRRIRLSLGLSVAALARMIGTNPRTVRRYEAGDRPLAGPVVVLMRSLDGTPPALPKTKSHPRIPSPQAEKEAP